MIAKGQPYNSYFLSIAESQSLQHYLFSVQYPRRFYAPEQSTIAVFEMCEGHNWSFATLPKKIKKEQVGKVTLKVIKFRKSTSEMYFTW